MIRKMRLRISAVLALVSVSSVLVVPRADAVTTGTLAMTGTHTTSSELPSGGPPVSSGWSVSSTGACPGTGASSWPDYGLGCGFSASGSLTGTCIAWSGSVSGYMWYGGWGTIFFSGSAQWTSSVLSISGRGTYGLTGDSVRVDAVFSFTLVSTPCQDYQVAGIATATPTGTTATAIITGGHETIGGSTSGYWWAGATACFGAGANESSFGFACGFSVTGAWAGNCNTWTSATSYGDMWFTGSGYIDIDFSGTAQRGGSMLTVSGTGTDTTNGNSVRIEATFSMSSTFGGSSTCPYKIITGVATATLT